MEHESITLDYYSKWIGKDGILKSRSEGTEVFYSKDRDTVQEGYAQPFSLWVWKDEKRILISYGKKVEKKIFSLKNITPEISSKELKEKLETIFGTEVSHGIKYLYHPVTEIDVDARILQKNQYPDYLEFFLKVHPNCKNTKWLKAYFEEMVKDNYCCGVIKDGKIVSCTDAPGMPFLKESVQEIGINTVPEEQGKGYAAKACILCIKQMIKSGKCPQWSTDIQNIPSQKLAEKLGFQRLAEYFTLSV